MTNNFIFEPLKNYFMNPTRKWPVYGRQDLIYDLRSCSINGLCINAKLEEARQFGRCDSIDWWWKDIALVYQNSGLILRFGEGALVAVTVVFNTDLYTNKKMGPANLTFIDLSGRPHRLENLSILNDLKHCFGEPVESEEIGEGSIDHDFVVGKNFIMSNHDIKSGRLLNLEIAETADVYEERQNKQSLS